MAIKRKPRSREEWHDIIRQCEKRQGSIPKWCEENGINTTTYKYWVTRFNKEAKAKKEPQLTVFAELPIPSEMKTESQETVPLYHNDIIRSDE